ncbi:hypothetical protein CH252_04915 [Rhodococcus sp. 06-1477-1B]|nr:hypothetical protein CH252_04915 [Rhodococcus sp. 06-1477-1B]
MPATVFLYTLVIDPVAGQVANLLGYEHPTASVTVRVPLNHAVLELPNVGEVVPDRFLTTDNPQTTERLGLEQFTELVGELTVAYPNEKQEIDVWVGKVMDAVEQLLPTSISLDMELFFP